MVGISSQSESWLSITNSIDQTNEDDTTADSESFDLKRQDETKIDQDADEDDNNYSNSNIVDTITKKKKKNQVLLEGYVEAVDKEDELTRTKSLTDEDLDELKGCLDLGFGFSYEEIPELCNTLPALELCYSMSQKYLDEHHKSPDTSPETTTEAVSSPIANWKISSPGDHPEDVKARLKYWAQAVACTVRLCKLSNWDRLQGVGEEAEEEKDVSVLNRASPTSWLQTSAFAEMITQFILPGIAEAVENEGKGKKQVKEEQACISLPNFSACSWLALWRHGLLAFSSNLLQFQTSSCFQCFSHSCQKPKTAANHPQQLPPVLASEDVSSPALLSTSSSLSAQILQCKDLDDLLEDYKDKLNSKLVLQVLMNYKHLGRVKTLEFFSWAGMQMGFQFDDCVIEYMADFLGRRKLFDDIKCFLLTILSHRGRLSCSVFSICIRFLGRQGRVAEALSLFQEMETTFRCKPDNVVCNNILYVLCKKATSGELIDLALTIFHRIDVPDTYSYSNILVGLCKFGRLETALQVFRKMDRAGLVPTRSALNVLIGQFCLLSSKEGAIEKVRVKNVYRPFTILVPNVSSSSRKGAIEPAVFVFCKVVDLGMLPSAFVILELVSELCRLGKMEEAFKVVKAVEQRKMSCLEECYSLLMQALCEHNWFEEASFLFGRMLSLGVKPRLVVYNSIICMLSNAGNMDDAERVFKIMNKQRCLPDTVTYTALVHAYSKARNWEAAYSLLIEMLGLGLIPNLHTYNEVDKLLRENGKMDLCFKLESKMETQILLKHCKVGQLEAAYEKLNSMIRKGFHPPVYACDAFQQAFQKNEIFESKMGQVEPFLWFLKHQGYAFFEQFEILLHLTKFHPVTGKHFYANGQFYLVLHMTSLYLEEIETRKLVPLMVEPSPIVGRDLLSERAPVQLNALSTN
ncbi:hypothetical protein CCACVL1_10558 [Corchorus capsularis]|uniref:Pentacotripeptide-repeat region of PRORP domain-containing protein n=1 Tax=Corchorus capsularis TaxID=210143 RepID=A0A1R3IQS4_COCAP|nr:hypothetical protein CCACVL1_10558 [Corchorus capsularis]